MLYFKESTIVDPSAHTLYGMSTKGERIKEARLAVDLKQPELARLVGVTKQAVSHWETGRTKDIRNATFAKIAEVTGYSARWLATGKGPRFETGGGMAESSDIDLVRKLRALSPDDQAYIHSLIERLVPPRTTKNHG